MKKIRIKPPLIYYSIQVQTIETNQLKLRNSSIYNDNNVDVKKSYKPIVFFEVI